MKVTVIFKAQGRKDYMGYQWYKCIVDGVEAIRFTYSWYALMKNSFINESVSIPVK